MTKPLSNTLQAVLENSVSRYRDKVAYTYGDDVIVTYTNFGQKAQELSYYLACHGINKQDKVSIIGENMPNWGIAYFACGSMGAVIVPVLVDFSPIEISSVLEHSEAKALIVSTKVYAKIKDKISFNGLIIIMNDFHNQQTGELVDDYWKQHEQEALNWTPESVLEEDLACIIYTSGTTGRSKGVMLTNDNIVWDAIMCTTLHPVTENDVYLSVLPLAHTYECTLGLVLGTMMGATTHYISKAPTANVLMPLMKKYRPTMMLTVPLIIEKIYKVGVKPKFVKTAFMRLMYKIRPFQIILHRLACKKLYRVFGGRLKFFGIGGAAVASEVERFLRDGRFPYSCGYGLTETAPMVCGLPVGKTKFRSVGPPMQGIECKLSGINPATGEGELTFRGRNVMKGYFKDPETTAKVLSQDGWFQTGDLGIMDKHGNVTLKGRSKNMILGSSGENIYPEEIEAIINEMDNVVESVVYQDKGRLVASVYLNEEGFKARYQELKESAHNYQEELKKRMENYLKELKEKVNQSVGRYSQLSDVELREVPFEKTATMKIKRFLLNKEKGTDSNEPSGSKKASSKRTSQTA
ncbi:MAG: AMP-binding protein [Bacteroidota bacterium]|nr:AMP-binding protein [Bacteroidota bacterium]